MNEQSIFDKTFRFILVKMVQTGFAPHYTEIAAELEVSMEEGRKVLHDLFSRGMAAWLAPDTDFIASFAPFNNQPTQYRIRIDGEQKWFGQWGFESLAVSWLFPGKTVHIDFPCLDCGLPIHMEMRDGAILKSDPEGLMGYVPVPYARWGEQWAYSWSNMNLFRSEEHIRNWAQFDPENEDGMISSRDLLTLFSCEYFRRRMEPGYFSRRAEYRGEFWWLLKEMGKTHPFWSPPGD